MCVSTLTVFVILTQINFAFSRAFRQWDVIVVGAGVAGASLAYALGKEGRRVLLLERDLSEPVRIVGELLQPGGYLKLKELGLAHCVDEIDAQKGYGYAMYKDDGEALVG